MRQIVVDTTKFLAKLRVTPKETLMSDSRFEALRDRPLTRSAVARAFSAAPMNIKGLLAYLTCGSLNLVERLLDSGDAVAIAEKMSPSAVRAVEVCTVCLPIRECVLTEAEAFRRGSFGVKLFELFTEALREYSAADPTILRLLEAASVTISLLLTEGKVADADVCALLRAKLKAIGVVEKDVRRSVLLLDDLFRFLGSISETISEPFPALPVSGTMIGWSLEEMGRDERCTVLFMLRSLSNAIFESVGGSDAKLRKRLAAAALLPSVRASLFAQATEVRKFLPDYEKTIDGWLANGGLTRMDAAVRRLSTAFARMPLIDPCYIAIFLLHRCLKELRLDDDKASGHPAEKLLNGFGSPKR